MADKSNHVPAWWAAAGMADDAPELTLDEERFIRAFRSLSAAGKAEILGMMQQALLERPGMPKGG